MCILYTKPDILSIPKQTYCANTQVADSACTATAYLGGVKANYATIGLTASVSLGDCYGQNNTAYHVDSIAKWAQDSGMSTGKHTIINKFCMTEVSC